jgi:hypothetical protein
MGIQLAAKNHGFWTLTWSLVKARPQKGTSWNLTAFLVIKHANWLSNLACY